MDGQVKKRSLLDIQNDIKEYSDLLDRVDLNDLSDEDRERLDAFEADIEKEFDEKVDSVGAFYKELKASGEARQAIRKSMQALETSELNKAERIKGLLYRAFTTLNVGKKKTLRCNMWVQNNGQPAFIILDETLGADEVRIAAEVPERFWKRTLSIDWGAVKAELNTLAPKIALLEQAKADFAAAEAVEERMELEVAINEIEGELAGTAYDYARLVTGTHLRIK